MKRGFRFLIWPGSLILLVAVLLTIDFTMVVLARRSSDAPPAATGLDDRPTDEAAP